MNYIEILKDIEYDIVKYKLKLSELPDNKIIDYNNKFICNVNISESDIKSYYSTAIKFKSEDNKVIAEINIDECPMELNNCKDEIKLAAIMSITNQKIATNELINDILNKSLVKDI